MCGPFTASFGSEPTKSVLDSPSKHWDFPLFAGKNGRTVSFGWLEMADGL